MADQRASHGDSILMTSFLIPNPQPNTSARQAGPGVEFLAALARVLTPAGHARSIGTLMAGWDAYPTKVLFDDEDVR